MTDDTPSRLRRPFGFGWRRGRIVWTEVDQDGRRRVTDPLWFRLRGLWVEARGDDMATTFIPASEVYEIVETDT